MLEEELQHRIEAFKGHEIEVGDLVLVKNMVAHKEQLKYYKDLYQVLCIKKSRYYCAPLFGKATRQPKSPPKMVMKTPDISQRVNMPLNHTGDGCGSRFSSSCGTPETGSWHLRTGRHAPGSGCNG
jgi:hypothetical protein